MLSENIGFFGRMSQRITDALTMSPSIDEDFFEELEEILITSDIGMETTIKIVETLRREVRSNNLTKPEVIKIRLGKIIAGLINKGEAQNLSDRYPLVILMIGINGGGKTTSIAKIAHRLKKDGRKVMLAAADTFRAAASEQLCIWGDRVGVNVVRHGEGADPSAVIYDAIQSAKAKGMDVLICDTAGRLQNKKTLWTSSTRWIRLFPENGLKQPARICSCSMPQQGRMRSHRFRNSVRSLTLQA